MTTNVESSQTNINHPADGHARAVSMCNFGPTTVFSANFITGQEDRPEDESYKYIKDGGGAEKKGPHQSMEIVKSKFLDKILLAVL